MDHQSELQLIARVIALEYLLKRVFWLAAVNQADLRDDDEAAILDDLSVYAADAEDDLRDTTTTASDPAIGDHVVALVSENVRRLVDETASLIRKHSPHLRR